MQTLFFILVEIPAALFLVARGMWRARSVKLWPNLVGHLEIYTYLGL